MCPLCLHSETELFNQDKHRSFYLCMNCDLVFVNRMELISEDLEKKRYDSHENSEDGSGYRSYLNNIATSIKAHLSPNDHGLDFGCGRTKILEELLSPWRVDSFDLYFHSDKSLLLKKYDFIILSEVIEHLRDPRETMLSLSELLNPHGRFFIKTKLRPGSGDEFSKWFYKRDITHVQFFNEHSFRELAKLCQLNSPERIGDDLFLFKK